jgi:uncharacterized protein YciI
MMQFPILRLVALLPLFLLLNACSGKDQHPSEKLEGTLESTTGFDQKLADKFGADDYGMKKYVMAFLKAGPYRSQDSLVRAQLQRAHMDNINKLAQEGKLILAGPFLDDGNIRGIYIFDVKTIEEAEALTKTDPAIQAGSLTMELHPWYGSAALMQTNELHKKLAKLDF